jgi:hypothetical protein
MMTDFELAIQKETSKTPVTGGGVHPLTRYVMNYLSFLTDYNESIGAIFENWKLSESSPLPLPESLSGEAHPEDLYSSPVSVRIAWVILLTLCKIDGKAQPYKDVALSYLFLANNLQYVVVKVGTSNLRVLLGDDWVVRHEAKVKQYADKFEKLAWGKVLTSLPGHPAEEMSPEEATEIYTRFNEEFEASYRRQISWVIPDPKLRDEIKISLSRKLVRVCTEFYERNRDTEFYKVNIARYTPEDIGNYLSDLYFGSRGSGSVSAKGSGSGSGTGSSTTGKSRGGRSH